MDPIAFILAGVMADAPADAREWIGLPEDGKGLIESATGDGADIAGDIGAQWAGLHTGGHLLELRPALRNVH